MFTSYGAGRYVASEGDVLMLPSAYKRDGTARGIVYCHGAGELAPTPLNAAGNKTYQLRLMQTLVEAGFPLVSCDLGVWAAGNTTDSNNWGSTQAQTRIGQAKTWLQSASGGGAKSGTVLLLGISMGNAAMVNYAKNAAAAVGAMVGILPVADIDDIYQNNRNSYRAAIGSAWGVTFPAALPANSNPATSNSGAVGIPYRTYYASDDTIALPAPATALTTAIGGTATNLGALGHTDAAIGAVSPYEVADFFRLYAA